MTGKISQTYNPLSDGDGWVSDIPSRPVGAYLRGANLRGAYLRGTNLREAYLRGADLREAHLREANLRGADLSWANLREANLGTADLTSATLRGADLCGAYLCEADLCDADLTWCDLRGAELHGAKNVPHLAQVLTQLVPEHGEFFGWKKCRDRVLVHLSIPPAARRSNATGRKCRAEYVDVLEVVGADVGVSEYDDRVMYRVGERVTCDAWDPDRWRECGGGIHFYTTRMEAAAHLS